MLMAQLKRTPEQAKLFFKNPKQVGLFEEEKPGLLLEEEKPGLLRRLPTQVGLVFERKERGEPSLQTILEGIKRVPRERRLLDATRKVFGRELTPKERRLFMQHFLSAKKYFDKQIPGSGETKGLKLGDVWNYFLVGRVLREAYPNRNEGIDNWLRSLERLSEVRKIVEAERAMRARENLLTQLRKKLFQLRRPLPEEIPQKKYIKEIIKQLRRDIRENRQTQRKRLSQELSTTLKLAP